MTVSEALVGLSCGWCSRQGAFHVLHHKLHLEWPDGLIVLDRLNDGLGFRRSVSGERALPKRLYQDVGLPS